MPLALSPHGSSTAGFLLTRDPARKHYPAAESPRITGSDSMTEEFNDMFYIYIFNHLKQQEPWMLMGESRPQPTRNSDTCKTRQVGQDRGSACETGAPLRRCAEGLRGQAPGSECTCPLLSVGSQTSYPISVSLRA